MRVNNWAIAFVFAGAVSFALPVAAQSQPGGQSGGQMGGQTGGATGAGQSGTDVAGGNGTASATGAQPKSKGNLQKEIQQDAIGNMAEIQLGQLAQQNAQDPQVKQFAQTMIDQHTKAQNELKQVASASGVSLPTSLDSRHQKIQDSLSKLQGAAFDRAYVNEMVKDHKTTEKALQKQANARGVSSAANQSMGTAGTSGTSGATGTSGTSGTTGATGTTGTSGTEGTSGTSATSGAAGTSGQVSSIDAYASATLPEVQQHLQMARDLQKQVKDEGKSSKGSTSGYGSKK